MRPETVRVHGMVDGAFTQFAQGLDFVVTAEAVVAWRESEPGVPAADARWPDDGTEFWVGHDRTAAPAPPLPKSPPSRSPRSPRSR